MCVISQYDDLVSGLCSPQVGAMTMDNFGIEPQQIIHYLGWGPPDDKEGNEGDASVGLGTQGNEPVPAMPRTSGVLSARISEALSRTLSRFLRNFAPPHPTTPGSAMILWRFQIASPASSKPAASRALGSSDRLSRSSCINSISLP